jgi:hypothetical protein
MFNFASASNKVMVLMNTVVLDISCPAVKAGYYLGPKLQNALTLETLSIRVNRIGHQNDITAFANAFRVALCEYIYFADSLKKL